MEIGSILILMSILLPVLAYLAQPIITGQGIPVGGKERRLSTLEAERERLFSAIQEMDMDYSMGRIASVDYEAERSAKIVRSADIMRQIDALAGKEAASQLPKSGVHDRSLEAELEAKVAKMRKVQSKEISQYCPQCGGQIFGADRFCSSCGADVVSEESNQ